MAHKHFTGLLARVHDEIQADGGDSLLPEVLLPGLLAYFVSFVDPWLGELVYDSSRAIRRVVCVRKAIIMQCFEVFRDRVTAKTLGSTFGASEEHVLYLDRRTLHWCMVML